MAKNQTKEPKSITITSPLRYPGAKRQLVGYIKECLKINGLRPSLFVEPFAGGASVSLQLLQDDLVDRIGLNDLDPWVASFWETVFFDADWLVEQIEKIPGYSVQVARIYYPKKIRYLGGEYVIR